MADHVGAKDNAAGMAALAICESLLIALSDLKIMAVSDTAGVLRDAADAHRNAGGTGAEATLHQEVATIIERIMTGGNSVLPH